MISDRLQTAKSELIDALRQLEREPKVPLTRVRELERMIFRLESFQHKVGGL